MGNKGRSERGFGGTIHHYDEHGKKVGRSEPGFFGGYTNYDAKGNKVGHSDPGLFGGMNHYDKNGKKVGRSEPGLFGSYTNYDAKGNKTGHSDPSFGGYSHSDGCYIATCVYSSYDCPQVWTLRRFRDGKLGATALGRAFIKTYYAVSPKVVKLLGNNRASKTVGKFVLDAWVSRLQKKGFQNTPYKDVDWRK